MDYYQGYDDAMRQARVTRGSGLFGFLLRIVICLLYSAFIYVPLLIVSFILAESMSNLYSNDIYIKLGLTLGIGYLMFAGIYFLKGLLIGLRQNNHLSWVLLFVLCILLTCGVQSIGAHSILQDFFASRNVANHGLWSLLGAGVVALLIYSHYQFLSNVAPRFTFWSYKLGFYASLINAKERQNIKPAKSATYFDNAPMKISFRKHSDQ